MTCKHNKILDAFIRNSKTLRDSGVMKSNFFDVYV